MSETGFVHLRVRSAWSLLESTVRVPKLVGKCQELAMPAVAMTDHASLFGAFDFGKAAASGGVQPLVGCLLPVKVGETERGASIIGPLTLLCQSAEGYGSLLKLLSDAYLQNPDDELWTTLDAVESNRAGLLCLSGGSDGALGKLFAAAGEVAGGAAFEWLCRIFDDRLYVELTRLGTSSEAKTEPWFLDVAYSRGLPLAATNDVRFLEQSDALAHDVLACVAAGERLADPDRARRLESQWFKPAGTMAALFEDLPEAIANTAVVARRCGFMIPARPPILPPFAADSGRDETAELRAQAKAGLERRLEAVVFPRLEPDADRAAVAQRYRERLDYELDVIVQMQFPGYFLIVSDFIRWAKSEDIPVGPGRGSGAGSVVAWSLEITDLDPLRFGLLFERFLNPERVSMPDFDIDFCQDRRDDVIAYVQQKYGADRVAHIITFGKLQARAVVRDVGRVLGMPYGQVDRISKLIPHNPASPPTLEQALEMEPQLTAERRSDEQVDELMTIAQQLEGLPRHASTHAAGVVIGDRPLDELVPLYRDPRSHMPVTQFDMKAVEKVGLVKFDFLGLTTLTQLKLATELVNREPGMDLKLEDLELDDKPTYELMSRAETNGVFQLESGGMKTALRDLKPDCFEDIIAMVSLYRPGPMDNIPRYAAVKHGREDPAYLHSKLEPILAETNGVIIYQEQVMQIARDIAGYSLGAADILRRAMGKKNQQEMDTQRAIFVAGAVERGLDDGLAETLFDQVAKFASYGFNKSHAACYALLAYHTGYLKANHPLQFFAASMTLDRGNHARLANAREEMMKRGFAILPPSVNESDVLFAVERPEDSKGAIRFALSAIRGVGEEAMQSLVDDRRKAGPFADICNLAARLGPKKLNRRLLEALIRAGALDCLGPNRATHIAAIDGALRYAQAIADQADAGQAGLFDAFAADQVIPKPPLPKAARTPTLQVLDEEYRAIGFFLSAHPLDSYRSALTNLKVTMAAELTADGLQQRQGPMLHAAGLVVAKQERTSARSRFAFVMLSDPTGQFEVTVYADLLTRARPLLDSGQPLLVYLDARVEGDYLRLIAQDMEPLSEAIRDSGDAVTIDLRTVDALASLLELLTDETTASVGVHLRVPGEGAGERVTVALGDGARLPLARRPDVDGIDGVLAVRDAGLDRSRSRGLAQNALSG